MLSSIQLHVTPAGDPEAPVSIARVLADEPDPFYNPQLSLDQKNPAGWGPFPKIDRPRSCVLIFAQPSIGSWVTWGLGSENQNLPGFIVLMSGGQMPRAGKSVWGSGFLPSVYQGVQCRSAGDPALNLRNPEGIFC